MDINLFSTINLARNLINMCVCKSDPLRNPMTLTYVKSGRQILKHCLLFTDNLKILLFYELQMNLCFTVLLLWNHTLQRIYRGRLEVHICNICICYWNLLMFVIHSPLVLMRSKSLISWITFVKLIISKDWLCIFAFLVFTACRKLSLASFWKL